MNGTMRKFQATASAVVLALLAVVVVTQAVGAAAIGGVEITKRTETLTRQCSDLGGELDISVTADKNGNVTSVVLTCTTKRDTLFSCEIAAKVPTCFRPFTAPDTTGVTGGTGGGGVVTQTGGSGPIVTNQGTTSGTRQTATTDPTPER